MRVILDGCLPKRRSREIAGHDVTTVQQEGLAGIKNGELLKRLSGSIDVFVTADSNLPSQQKLSALPFGVLVMRARSNKMIDLLPLLPDRLAALATIKPGELVLVVSV